MIRSNLNLIVLLIAWISIFSLAPSVSGLRQFSYNETQLSQLSSPNSPRIWNSGVYTDGTVLLHIIARNPNVTRVTGVTTVIPKLFLRIIHPNGTVTEVNKDLVIQGFNWNITTSSGGDLLNPIHVYPLTKGYVLVTYFNATNTDDYSTYQEWGRIIDWNEKDYGNQLFGMGYVSNGAWDPEQTFIVNNVDPEKGFLRLTPRNETHLEWQQYLIDSNFKFEKLSEGFIEHTNGSVSYVNAMASMDEGYSVIIANTTQDYNASNPFDTRSGLYVYTKGYDDDQFNSPKMIYQVSQDNVTLANLYSDISYAGVGQICTLAIQQIIANSTNLYYVKLNFLSSGSVIEFVSLDKNLPSLPSNSTAYSLGWEVNSVPYGGFLFKAYFQDENDGTNAYVYYFDDSSVNPIQWDFSEPTKLNPRGTIEILPNNTLLTAQPESQGSWSFAISDIPRFTSNQDHGYSNVHVNITNPRINSSILTSTNEITITYYEPVELSTGNISIYLIGENGEGILRQIVNGNTDPDYCRLSSDGLTVTVTIIESTFSIPNEQYYVKVGNNFVKNKAYGEPLLGISENIWKFSTSQKDETFGGTVTGVMRLTVEGTKYFDSLDGKNKFFENLQSEISKIIPVDLDRLFSDEKTQVDNNISPSRQIFVSLNIKSSKEERSVVAIVKDFDIMIKNKEVSPIGENPTTNYIDSDFGFQPNQNIWDQYKLRFLGVILALAVLLVLFLLAQRRAKQGRNMAILQLGLIIFDLVMDILFVSNNGKVVEVLYIPSVIFLTVPIGINTIWAFYIINNENKNRTFLEWFTQHGKVASVFTVLSGADIEALSILHSNLAGFEIFQAPFSVEGKSKIFWASCLNIFIEDIPQVIIQIIYQRSVITYDIIPFLALISSCLNLAINIVGRLYQAINHCRHGPDYVNTQNQEDFGGLQPLQTPSQVIDVKEEKEKINSENEEKNNLARKNSRSSFQEVIP